MSFTIIPVIDLRQGVVVHARGGSDRSGYPPLRSPLCPRPDPVAMAGALAAAARSDILYVADLDAIRGEGDNAEAVRAIAARHPRLELWVDAGIAGPWALDRWRTRCAGMVPVIGSESAGDAGWLAGQSEFVLSLDFGAGGLIGDPGLLQGAELWPARVIVMSLSRVGTGLGPELERLRQVRRSRPDVACYAAGGVRNRDDLQRLRRLGVRGALVASALHQGLL
jgi:phosphoribosylformimino-5-aminoimidazole carboxamide ribotide isomerase